MTSQRAQLETRIGSILGGKYTIVRLLGIGGMGAVFEGTNTWTGRRVAIKVMHTSEKLDPDLAARFVREARAATAIAHANIVDVLDMGQDPSDGSLFIVQEYLDGMELRTLMEQRGKLAPRECVDILVPVMSALMLAHKHGIVHRDLKPENIFLARTTSGTTVPKVIDFGIAKMESTSEHGLTRTGAVMGTPHYMSPEQVRGDRAIDQQSDVWAIGVVLHEMLSGATPFDGVSYNQLMIRIATESPRPIEDVLPTVSKRLAAVVRRALERECSQRFETMGQFQEAILDAVSDVDEVGGTSLRLNIDDAVKGSSSMGLVQTIVAETSSVSPAVASGAMAVSSKGAPSTPGSVGGEVVPGPRNARRWLGISGLGVVLATAALTVAFALRPTRVVRTLNATQQSTGPSESLAHTTLRAAPAPVSPTIHTSFVVTTTASPATSEIEIDGDATHSNAFARTFSVDGRRHHLVVTAPGFVPQRIEFVDAPPPEVIELLRTEVPTIPLLPVSVPVQSPSARSPIRGGSGDSSQHVVRGGPVFRRPRSGAAGSATPAHATGTNAAPIVEE